MKYKLISVFILTICLLISGMVRAESVVSVSAQVPGASEGGPTPGIYALTRTGDLSETLTVNYEFGGTAIQNIDYLVWETSIIFEVGVDIAFVTVMPRNDSLDEETETVTLSLLPGSEYTLGTSLEAEITIENVYFADFPGVFDLIEFPVLENDITYLDAEVANGLLTIRVGLNATTTKHLSIFLDTDQNSDTGDLSRGQIAGVEYRVQGLSFGFSSDYQLVRLPLTAEENEEFIIINGPASFNNNFFIVSIPLNAIGNPSAVDVMATTYKVIDSGTSNRMNGNGDRSPEYGFFDTATRSVVMRRQALTQSIDITDALFDVTTATGFDIVSANYTAIADQFQLVVGFSQGFDPGQAFVVPGPRGQVIFDSDQSLATGGIFMGGNIPSWGGDTRLSFDFSTPAIEMKLDFDPLGGFVKFGQQANDGRWLSGATFGEPGKLILRGSTSLLDAFFVQIKTLAAERKRTFTRIPSNGRERFEFFSLEIGPSLFDALVADALPGDDRVVDTANRQIIDPIRFDPQQLISRTDPAEFGQGGSGIDLIQIDSQVIDGNLVVKATLSSWLNTQTGNLYEIALDIDNDITTGQLIQNFTAPGAPAIGADYLFQILSQDGFVTFYVGQLRKSDETDISVHDALVLAEPQSQLGIPASFTVTIPLMLLGQTDPNIQFFVTAGQNLGVGELDIAPPQPISIRVANANSMNIRLYKGFNLFSYPFLLPTEIERCSDLIATLGSTAEIHTLKRFNPATLQFETCSHTAGVDFSLQSGEGYIIDSAVNKQLELNGDTGCTNRLLLPGFNIVAYNSLVSSSCKRLLSSLDGTHLIQRFNQVTGKYQSCVKNSQGIHGMDFPIIHGDTILMNLTSTTTLKCMI